MKLSARDKKLVIILIGVVAVALSYFLVFSPSKEEITALKIRNAELQGRFTELSEMANNVDQYEADTIENHNKIDKILKKFPSYLQYENEMMDVVNLEGEAGSFVSSYTISDPVFIDIAVASNTAPTDGTVPEGENTEDGEAAEAPVVTDENQLSDGFGPENEGTDDYTQWRLFSVSTTMQYDTGYKGLKKMVNFVTDSKERKSVNSFEAAFDNQSGKIIGTMIYDSYFLYGVDKPYEAPYIPNTKHGTKNIFGSTK